METYKLNLDMYKDKLCDWKYIAYIEINKNTELSGYMNAGCIKCNGLDELCQYYSNVVDKLK